jgi:hypothetical protein
MALNMKSQKTRKRRIWKRLAGAIRVIFLEIMSLQVGCTVNAKHRVIASLAQPAEFGSPPGESLRNDKYSRS